MYTLRDGSEVQDPRLDRLVEFDERSREYPARAVLDTTQPRSYTWRCNAWLDQGYEGACVGFSVAHELAARPSEVAVHKEMAREFYHQAQHIDSWVGCSYGHDGPAYEGTSVLSGVKTAQKAGYFSEYRWCFGIADALAALRRGPLVLGLNWYTGMFQPNEKGMIAPTGRIEGGHAILANGYNAKTGLVRLHNSWGQDWGINGECFISDDDFSRLLNEDGEAVLLLGRKKVPFVTLDA